MSVKAPASPAASPGAAPPEVLIIDANEDHQALSAIALGRRGFKVAAVDSGREGLRLALSQPFDAIVLDHKVRDLPAFEVLQGLVHRLPATPKIFVVAAGGEDQAVKAISAGATGYLVKTARYNEVLPVEVEDQIEKARTKARLVEQSIELAQNAVEREKVEEALRTFEDRVGMMSEQAPFILWTMDTALRFTSSVGSGLRSIGLQPNQVQGMRLQEFAQSEDPNLPMIAAHRSALEGRTARFEQEWKGRVFDVHLEPLRKKDGPILGVFGVALDVTERVHAERVQSALYRISQLASAAENLQDVLRAIHGIVGELMPANNFYIALHDPATNTLSFPYFVDEEESPPDPQPVDRGLTEYVLRTGTPLLASPEVFQHLLESGEVDSVGPPSIDWLGVPLTVKERVFGVLVVQSYTEGLRYTEAERDLLRFVCSQIAMVIDRKRAEESLRESERALSTMLSRLPGVAYRTRYDERRTNEFVSEGCHELLGYRPEELIHNAKVSGLDLIHPDDRRGVAEETAAAVQEHRPYRIHYRIRTAAGEEKWVWDQGHAIYGPDDKAVALEGLLTDVTEWKAVVNTLQDMGIFRALFDAANEPILLLDAEGKVLDANPMAEALLARERGALLGKAIEDFVWTEPVGSFRRRLEDLFQGRRREDIWDAVLRSSSDHRRGVRLRARLIQEAGTHPLAELRLRDLPGPAASGTRALASRMVPPRA